MESNHPSSNLAAIEHTYRRKYSVAYMIECCGNNQPDARSTVVGALEDQV